MAAARPDSLELSDYLGAFRRRWWIVLVLAVVGTGLAAGYAKVATKSYTAAVLIQVNPLPNNANQVGGRTSGPVDMDNEAQIVQSYTVAAQAAQRMHSQLTPANLLKKISVSVPANTTFLQVDCDAGTAPGAATCANAFAAAYLNNRHNTIIASVSGQLKANSDRITTMSNKVAHLKTQINSLPSNSPQRTSLQLTVRADDQLMQTLENDNSVLYPLLDALNQPNNAAVGRVGTPATPPLSASSPRLLLLLPSGLLAGLLLGFIAAYLVDRRDRRVHSAREIERFLDTAVLLSVPRKAALSEGLVASRSKIGQAFTELAQYIASVLGNGSHVLLVAGTSVGPGCSTVAANLAVTLARTRSDVVLLCADPDSTVTPQILGIGRVRGLAEVLTGAARVSDVAVQADGNSRLRVITPGLDTSSALLHMQYDASRRLISELLEDARYVVIEAQSMGAYTDSFQFAEFADGAIMTVETELTNRTDAADCLNRLDRLRTTVLGAAVVPATRLARKAAPEGPPQRPAAGKSRPRPVDDSLQADAPRARREMPRPPDATRPPSRPRPASPSRGGSDSPRPAEEAHRPQPATERQRPARRPDETWPLPQAATISLPGLPERTRKAAELKEFPDKAAGA